MARSGTSQFAVLLAEVIDPEGEVGALRRIVEAFDRGFDSGDNTIHVTAGIGISSLPADGLDAVTLLRSVATALASVRPLDAEPYQFYRKDMTVAATRRLLLQEELRQAIERQELEVHYEPQVDLGHTRIVGAEALVRWCHPKHGPVPPSEFIPIAERSGLIISLGDLVLRSACRQGVVWKAAGLPEFPIAVNVSREQFRAGNFAARVRDILADTGFAASTLVLELTESTILQNPDRVIRLMESLTAQGVRFAIDDFGIEHSALSFLARLPVYAIKIDIAFISRMTIDPRYASLVQAIVTMARVMGMKTVAEGVETTEQHTYLRAYGCDALQGYLLFSRAMAANEFAKLVCERESDHLTRRRPHHHPPRNMMDPG